MLRIFTKFIALYLTFQNKLKIDRKCIENLDVDYIRKIDFLIIEIPKIYIRKIDFLIIEISKIYLEINNRC